MGLWLELPELSLANASLGKLAASLQLAPATQWHWRLDAYGQTQSNRK